MDSFPQQATNSGSSLCVDGYAPAGQVWHFSEDPSITEFVPHVACTAKQVTPYVWACDAARCPDYWFGRQCPRAMAWRRTGCDQDAADRVLGDGVDRLHVIETGSVASMGDTQLYAYPFDGKGFYPLEGYAMVSESLQVPLGPPIKLASPWLLHAHAGIPVLVLPDLFGWLERAIAAGLGFSGIRLRRSANFREL